MPIRVLLLSASMGAGHEGAATELQRRLRVEGHHATVVDFLAMLPTWAAFLWRESYHVQMRRLPESYERTYRLYHSRSRAWGLLVGAATRMARRRLERQLLAERPDVVVSTYPFATLALGELRSAGRLVLPVVNYLTDLGVHPRCVHRDIDLNLVPHKVSALAAEAVVDVPTVVTGPVVGPSFAPATPERRAEVRAGFGIDPAEVVVAVVAGSWGVGQVRSTVDDLLAAGRFHVVVVCGNDRHLRADLERRGSSRLDVLGWTNDMAGVLAAADVVVENAGGLSAFEAMAAGVPVLTYLPIPGHGRENAVAMEEAGITEVPAGRTALAEAVDRLSRPGVERDQRLEAAAALFAVDPIPLIVEAAGVEPVIPLDDTTAYASNWRTVLLLDAALGVVIAVVGVISIARWSPLLGVVLTGLGSAYLLPIVRRARRWRALRREAGL